jgi:hypothetical protein
MRTLPLPHASPVVLDKLALPLSPRRLTRNSVFAAGSAAKYPEKFLQELIHSDPGILPVEEVDRAFVGLRPVCQELALAGGTKYIDNLLINSEGRICIVECNLWRNPEAVREVVAQVLDYAAELSRLSYSQLETGAAKASRENSRDFLTRRVLGDDAPVRSMSNRASCFARRLSPALFLFSPIGRGSWPSKT